jgi:hypothetical protein
VTGIYAFAVAVVALAMVMAGAAIGVLAVVSLGIRREERDLSLTSDITARAARGARRLNGLYTREPGVIEQVRRYRHDT